MNKIYKVVWNKARNCYVVGSEFISSHSAGKTSTIGSKSLKTLLAVFAVYGVMGTAWATEPTANPTEYHHYVAFSDKDFNNGQRPGSTYQDENGNQYMIISDGTKQYRYNQDTITVGGKNQIYWVRDGYTLTITNGAYTPIHNDDIKADVVWTGKVHDESGAEISGERPKDVLEFGNSMVYQHETTTNAGESLNIIQAGTYVGVANAGGTKVDKKWEYIIYDPSRDADSTYKNGWVNLQTDNVNDDSGPKGFISAVSSSDLKWDETTQQYEYTKKGKTTTVDISNLYVIDGKIGIFTTGNGDVYTGSVYGKNNEILMTTKDTNGNYYSYWAAKVTDPSATMASYRVDEYNRNIDTLVSNDQVLYHNDIQTVSMENGDGKNTATISLLRNLNPKKVDGDITITENGGTKGEDTSVTISNNKLKRNGNGHLVDANDQLIDEEGYFVDQDGKRTGGKSSVAYDTKSQTFNTGSVVKANDNVGNDATDGGDLKQLSINGKKYTIPNSSANDWTPMVGTTEVTPKQGTDNTDNNKKHVTFAGSNNIDVKADADKGTITIDGSQLAKNDLSNVTTIIGSGETTIKNIAKNAVKVSAGNKGITVSQPNKGDDPYDYQVSVNANTEKGIQVDSSGVSVKNGQGLSFDASGNLQVNTSDVLLSYRTETGKSKSVSLDTGLTFKSGNSGNVTISTNNNEADGVITIDAKNNYVTNAAYDPSTKKLTLTRNGDLGALSVDLTTLTSGLSSTDYRLVANEGTDGKYTVDENGNINLKVQNGNDKENAQTVTIAGVARASDVKELNDFAVKYDKVNDTKANKNSVTFAGDPYQYTSKDSHLGGTKLSNVAYAEANKQNNGYDGSAAVNVDLLNDTLDSITTSVTQGHTELTADNQKVNTGKYTNGNIQIQDNGEDGKHSYDVKLNDKIQLGKSADEKTYQTVLDGANGLLTIGGTLKLGVQSDDTTKYYLTGLSNTTWSYDYNHGQNYQGYKDSNRAATEGQLYGAFSYLNTKIDNITINDKSHNTNITPDDTKKNQGTTDTGSTGGTTISKEPTSPSWTVTDNPDGQFGSNDEQGKVTEGSITVVGQNGNITINGKNEKGVGSGTIDGLANKTWDATKTDQYEGSGKAATEAQLQQAMGGTVQYDRDSQGNVTNNITLNKDGDSVTITNVADGKVEKGSKDAVNGGQLYETNQAIANNAANISSLSNSLSNLDNRVNKVGAGAAALAALHPLDFDPDAKWDFAAGYGNYRGTNAAAVGAYYRPNEDTMFSIGGTFGNGENMVNAGVSFKLGAGSSHVSTSRVAMAKEIKELRSELEAMKSAMLDANAGKKIDTSKLQLFPDVPQNHWAYEYVAQLAGNGMIEGYPDGNFAGDRPMTRYEFAAILYRAMTKGAVLSDKILNEFSHELEYFTVDTVAKDKAGNPTIQRVRTVKANTNK